MGENDCILFSIESVGKADFLVITHLNMGQSQTTGKGTGALSQY